jgi:hypothetical protein
MLRVNVIDQHPAKTDPTSVTISTNTMSTNSGHYNFKTLRGLQQHLGTNAACSEKLKALLSSNKDAKKQEDAARPKILIQNNERMSTRIHTQAEAAQAVQLAPAHNNDARGLVFASVDAFNKQDGSDWNQNSNHDANNADIEVNDFYPGASDDELEMEVNETGAEDNNNEPSDDDRNPQCWTNDCIRDWVTSEWVPSQKMF